MVLKCLENVDHEARFRDLYRHHPGRRLVRPLLSFIRRDDVVKWRAVGALGALTAELAGTDLESAREVVRQLIWSTTEESGNIPWGAPESLGEILARSERLAEEYADMLISLMREEGNFLEHEPLQRGVLWGLARVAQVRPELLREMGALVPLGKYLDSVDGAVRGLAIRAIGLLQANRYRTKVSEGLHDSAEVNVYLDGEPAILEVSDLAREALARLE